MGHAYRETQRAPAPGTPPGLGQGGAPALPRDAAARWTPVALPPRRPLVRRAPPFAPVVLAVALGDRARSWAIDPGLLWIAAGVLAAIGVGALDGLLAAILTRLF